MDHEDFGNWVCDQRDALGGNKTFHADNPRETKAQCRLRVATGFNAQKWATKDFDLPWDDDEMYIRYGGDPGYDFKVLIKPRYDYLVFEEVRKHTLEEREAQKQELVRLGPHQWTEAIGFPFPPLEATVEVRWTSTAFLAMKNTEQYRWANIFIVVVGDRQHFRYAGWIGRPDFRKSGRQAMWGKDAMTTFPLKDLRDGKNLLCRVANLKNEIIYRPSPLLRITGEPVLSYEEEP